MTRKTVTVTSPPLVLERLGLGTADAPIGATRIGATFTDPASKAVAKNVIRTIEKLASDVATFPSASRLADPEVQARVLEEVNKRLEGQLTLDGVTALDIPAITAATCTEYPCKRFCVICVICGSGFPSALSV